MLFLNMFGIWWNSCFHDEQWLQNEMRKTLPRKFNFFVLTWLGDGPHQTGCLRGSLLLADVLWLHFLYALVFRFLVFNSMKSLLVEVTHKGRLCALVTHTWTQSSLSQFSLLRCVPKTPQYSIFSPGESFFFLPPSPSPPSLHSSSTLSLLPPCAFIFLEILYDLALFSFPCHCGYVLFIPLRYWGSMCDFGYLHGDYLGHSDQ